MTALRWFLSYLLPMLILASIAAVYYYRDQLSADWYRTLSWPVTQINDALQHQKLQINVVEPAISTELTTKKSNPIMHSSETANENNSLAMTSDAQAISKIKSKIKNEVKNTSDEKPLMHPIESTTTISSDAKGITALMHPTTPQTPKMPILPEPDTNVTAKSLPNKIRPTDKLALAPQQYFMPYPQQRMMPPVMRPMAPGLNSQNFNSTPKAAPKPPTQFKLTKKQLKLLYQARKAFWLNDLIKAKKHYLTLISELSDNPDIHGELGNLFYRERKLESAIKHYAIAAKLLIKHRHYWKLPPIMQIVSRFNPAKATEIMHAMRNRNRITTSEPGNNKKGK